MLETGHYLAAHGLDGRHDGILLAAQSGLYGQPIRFGELLAGHAAADHGDWVARQLQDDRARALSERRALNWSTRDAGQMRPSGLGVGAGRDERYRQNGKREAGRKAKRLANSRSSTHGFGPL